MKQSFLLGSICLLTILGLVIFCYDDDLTDNYDPPIFTIQSSIIVHLSYHKIILLKLISESINIPLIDKKSFLTRAPPA